MCPDHDKVQSHMPLSEGIHGSVGGSKNSKGLCPVPLSSQTSLVYNSESKEKGLF